MGNNVICAAACAKSSPPPNDDNTINILTVDGDDTTAKSRRQQNNNINTRTSAEVKAGRKGVRGSSNWDLSTTPANDLHGSDDTPLTPKFFTKTAEQQQFLEKCFASNFLSHIVNEPDEITQVIYAMECQHISAGTTIINQGDVGDYFYIIEDGVVSFEVDAMRVGGAMAGDCFGETALLFDCPRQATVVVDRDVTVWRLDQKTFRYMLARNAKQEMQSNVDILKTVPFLKNLNLSELSRIVDAMVVQQFKDNERIFDKGAQGDLFYILKSGMVKLHDIGHEDSKYVDQILKAGSFFGEKALMTDEPRSANATAVTDGTSCLCLKRDDFRKLFGNVGELIESAARRNVLISAPVFARAHLSQEEVNKMMNLMERQTFSQDFEVGMGDRGFFIIEEGKVNIRLKSSSNGEEGTMTTADDDDDDMDHSRHLGKGDYFGGVAEEVLTVELVSTTICCHVITNENIQLAIGEDKRRDRLIRASVLLNNVTVDSFTYHGVLGVGAFGSVNLISLGGESSRDDEQQSFFAMKQLSKRHLIDSKSVKQIFREKQILTVVNHPLVVKIHTAFQSPSDLYLVTSFLPGGELFDIIYSSSNFSGLSIDASVFYSACALESLSYLHTCSVCYRDLKPENIMIDERGYGILIDFGFAKILTEEKTYTLCGTPQCMAPEVILSKGHNNGADYWSLGVLIFEMLAGFTPFAAKGISELVIFKRIIKAKYYFPKKPTFTDAGRDLIEKLLEKKSSRRLGCLAGGGDDVKNHEFFESIDWYELYEGTVAAPFVPNCDLQALIKEIQENPKDVDVPMGGELLEEEEELFVNF